MSLSFSKSGFKGRLSLSQQDTLTVNHTLSAIGVPLVLVLLFAIALNAPSQGREIARMLTDATSADKAVTHFLWLFSATTFWSLSLWNWARIRYGVLAPDWRQQIRKWRWRTSPNRWLNYHLIAFMPRVLGVAPFLILAFSILNNGSADPKGNASPMSMVQAAFMLTSGIVAFILYTYRMKWLSHRFILPMILSGLTVIICFIPVIITILVQFDFPATPWWLNPVGWISLLSAIIAWLTLLQFIMPPTDYFSQWRNIERQEIQRSTVPFIPPNALAKHWSQLLSIQLDTAQFIIFQIITISFFGILFFGGFPIQSAGLVGPGAIVVYAFAAMLPVLSIISVYCQLLRVPFGVILIAILGIGSIGQAIMTDVFKALPGVHDRYAVRSYKPAKHSTSDGKTLTAKNTRSPGKVQLIDYISDWQNNTQQFSTHPATPILFITAAGGGQKAAFWTASVLGKLQDLNSNFDDHVFVISAVSGGALGTMTYAALINEGDLPDIGYLTRGQDVLKHDSLSPALASLFFSDLLNYMTPFSLLPDRASTLERTWEAGWRNRTYKANPPNGQDKVDCTINNIFASNFLCLWSLPTPHWSPALLINGAHKQLGTPIITSNLDIQNIIPDAWDFYDLFSSQIRVSTAVHNAARFPLISPAGLLTGKNNRNTGQIIDGGYIDNYGAEVMLPFAEHVLNNLANDDGRLFQPIFIEITNDAGEACRTQRCSINPVRDLPAYPAPGFIPLDEVITPIIGLASAETRADSAADTLKAFATHYSQNAPSIKQPVYMQFRLCDVVEKDIPLGWAQAGSTLSAYTESLSQNDDASSCNSINAETIKDLMSHIPPTQQ